ncbi:MAG: choice-of-anchor A family protein [Litoreibacter sp.]
MTVKTALVGAVMALAPVSVAQAATLDATELLQQYNVITRGDFTNRTDDIEGNAFIGGNVTSGNIFEFGAQDATPRADVAELVVLGDVDSSINLIRGGNAQRDVFIAGSSNVRFENSAVQTTDANLVPENVIETLDTLSADLAGLEANLSATRGSNRLTLNADGAEDGVAVFDLTVADLNLGEIDALLGDASLVVINVTGGGNIATNFLGNSLPFGAKTIWNFLDADEILFERTFVGQVLAGSAQVSNRGNLEGSLFASSFIQGAEAHINLFDGEIPSFSDDNVPDVTSVPLPAGFLTLFSGVLLLGRLRKRAS